MKNLLIAFMVFGMCALVEDTTKWIGQPYTELVKQAGRDYTEGSHAMYYHCDDYTIAVRLDMYGNIKEITVKRTRPGWQRKK